MIKGTSHNPFDAIETFSSSFFEEMAKNAPILRLEIGGKASKINIEIDVYFDDDHKQLWILGGLTIGTSPF